MSADIKDWESVRPLMDDRRGAQIAAQKLLASSSFSRPEMRAWQALAPAARDSGQAEQPGEL